MRPPVFILGCPRSGTSFLYHMLVSAGGFAEFRTQMNAYDVLEPIYGDLRVLKNRKLMLNDWLQSKAFAVSGLDAWELQRKVLSRCQNAGDFLRVVMEEVALRQGVNRWIDSTPTNIPHLLRIHRDFPEAQIVHIIRDGRDVALSLDKKGWSRPLPWQKGKSLLAAGLYWEWIVRKGRRHGNLLGPNYLEVRYEDLVRQPDEVLPRIGDFLQHDLDYKRIQQVRIGSMKRPLTSFEDELGEGKFMPVGRWKEKFPPDQLVQFELLVGRYLQELGYPLSDGLSPSTQSFASGCMRWTYGVYYPLKQWAKVNTPLSRMTLNYSAILIDK
jgi:hypothetical protein